MTIEVSVIVSGVSIAAALYFGILNVRRQNKSDDKSEATQTATIIVKLEDISRDTNDIKNELKDLKTDVKSHTEQIVRLDESLKSAWKRINCLEGTSERKDE